jgi:predicted NBD/HSP70 family sugar kinase
VGKIAARSQYNRFMSKRSSYKLSIVKQLYFSHSISSGELSRKIHKSLSLTLDILEELRQEGYIIENGYAESNGGRRPVMYSLRPGMGYIMAVAMDQFVTRIVIMDMRNNPVIPEKKIALPLIDSQQALSILTDEIQQSIAASGININQFLGVGIAMPGFVDSNRGVNYSYLDHQGKNIAEFISQKIRLPVYIDNDASLIALAEQHFGAVKDMDDALVVNIGWGIGMGIIINNRLIRGNNGFAGEFSHISLFANEKLCICGKTGCLDTEASLIAIVGKARHAIGKGKPSLLKDRLGDKPVDLEKDMESIITAAESGDMLALDILSETGYYIGRGLSVLILIFNPKLIVLSGRGSLAGKLWQNPVQHAILKYTIPRLAEETVVRVSTLGHNSDLIGAAALVIEKYESREYEELSKRLSAIAN